jgi:hypothetical protein
MDEPKAAGPCDTDGSSSAMTGDVSSMVNKKMENIFMFFVLLRLLYRELDAAGLQIEWAV